jgi:hypothetical protein
MTIYQIDDARPFITHNSLPVQWHTGSAPLMALMSSLVRINARGITYKPRAWHLRSLPGWEAMACAPSAFGLCETSNASVIFPSSQTPQVNEELDWRCGSTATAREVTTEDRYDVSACDVLDADVDYVWRDGTLLQATTDLPVWIYWVVCLLIVYLVRCLSKYVLASLSKDKTYPEPVLCVAACVACLVLVVSQGDFVYVTEEELMFYHFTIFYIASYACLFLGSRALQLMGRAQTSDPPFYNLLAGVMLLVATRLYCGAETPYNPPLIFIIATRLLVKSRRGADPLRAVTVLLDAVMLGLTCTLGFGPSHHYLVALGAAAGAASDVLVVA